ncbi:hypothetical protein TL16_g03921 [Triparma laevis f. inornata]|uniref:Uncharacterized protein n=1 Tax=Triparma laevis f. inornata TaxID=1714386 RepID=A0A9W7A1N2_9STRA|nr:hypothetical protein TL16_g03921 [Triparma laevis f. inornata]
MSEENAFTAFTSVDTTRKTFGSDGAGRWQDWNKSDAAKVGKGKKGTANLPQFPRKKGEVGELSGSLTWEEEQRISREARAETGQSSGYVNFNTKKDKEKDRKSAPIMAVGPAEDNMKMKSDTLSQDGGVVNSLEPPDGVEFMYADKFEGKKEGYVFGVRGDDCGYFWDPASDAVDDTNAVDSQVDVNFEEEGGEGGGRGRRKL